MSIIYLKVLLVLPLLLTLKGVFELFRQFVQKFVQQKISHKVTFHFFFFLMCPWSFDLQVYADLTKSNFLFLLNSLVQHRQYYLMFLKLEEILKD